MPEGRVWYRNARGLWRRAALQGGGAISLGLDDFKDSASCSAAAPGASAVTVTGCTFRGNVARLQGGAIALQSGTLSVQVRLRSLTPLLNCGAHPKEVMVAGGAARRCMLVLDRAAGGRLAGLWPAAASCCLHE